MNPKLEKLLKNQRALWRGGDTIHQGASGISTGFTALDAALPRQGWPADALLEIVSGERGEAVVGKPRMRPLLPS